MNDETKTRLINEVKKHFNNGNIEIMKNVIIQEGNIEIVSFVINDIFFLNHGWGNGYVAILICNELNDIRQKIIDNIDKIVFEQDITYNYFPVIGFDTAHFYNSSKHDKDYVVSEANKMLELIKEKINELLKREDKWTMEKNKKNCFFKKNKLYYIITIKN